MSFPQQVYKIVAKIPKGKVSTYGQIAALAGSPRAARIVGAALQRTPAGKSIPAHRVLYSDGTLCCDQAFGGKEIQRQILEQEGIAFLPDGRVDLSAHLWNGPEEDMVRE